MLNGERSLAECLTLYALLESVAAICVGGNGGSWGSRMKLSGMLIHRLGRLGAPVAVCCVEIQRADAVFAGDTFEGDPAVHWFGCVMSHNNIVAGYGAGTLGH